MEKGTTMERTTKQIGNKKTEMLKFNKSAIIQVYHRFLLRKYEI